MPSPKELAAGLRNQEATSPNSKVMFVGQEHGKKTALPDNVKKMVEKYGAYYEGAGGDKSDAIKYQGSWDDKASKEVKGYPKEFLYTLFTNSNVNNQKKNLTQPDKTIFDSALAAQGKWGYFKDRKFDADTLKQFLSASGMLDKSKQPATESNVKKFIDEGEGLMWPKNWEEYPNPAGKLAQKASEYRTNWLKSQKEGVYFVGSDHMKELNKPKANETAPSQLAKALARQDSVTKQPRNRFFGAVADAAGYLSDQADRYVVPERDPLFGGMRGGDLLPLRNVNRLLDDLSYGGRITTGRGQTTTLRPEVVDTVALGGAMRPFIQKGGEAALKTLAEQVQNKTGFARLMPDTRMSIVPEGASMPQRPKTEFEILHDTAQRNAALPKEQGGLALPSSNTGMDRAAAMGAVDYLHGTQRLDRLLSGKNLDPKRATSGPMPFGTDTPPVASGYAMNKQDTSRMADDIGGLDQYFQVSPKSLGFRGKNPYTVEQSWNHLSPEVKTDILDKSRRIGYKNPEEAEGAWTLHPTSKGAPFSPSHFEYELKAAKGNPLAALRSVYGESGMLDVYAPSELADIYKLAGYPHEISQANAPWTSAQGVLTGKAMINNPLKTSNVEEIRSTVIPALKEAFAKDKTRLKTSGSDEWAKDARYTPKEWVNQLEQDLAKGDNSYVWTSIPDKVTDQIKKLGYQGIIDTGGKGGDLYGHQVVIPFQPSQVRSRFAAFDPMRRHEADILAGVGVGGMLDPQAIAEALRQQDRK
jgi:hypothetical protein